MFNNAFSVQDHINNNLDPSDFPEETRGVLRGNIGAVVAGDYSGIYSTQPPEKSILGINGDVIRSEKIIKSQDGKARSQNNRMVNVPRSIVDKESPLFYGELGVGCDWYIINNPENNLGYSLDFDGNRTLGFSRHAVSGTDIKPVLSSPPIELVEKNGRIVPDWKPIYKAFPGLGAPVGDWTKQSNMHNLG